jgi:hypothetical protein
MNKDEAAAALGITVRTLQRHMAAHRIGFAMRRTATGEEATFSAEEVARFKAERDRLTETVTPAANVSEVVRVEQSHALQRAGSVEGMQAFASMVADALAGAQTRGNGQSFGHESLADLNAKVLLTLKDAARLSSLSDAHLRAALNDGTLRGKIIGRGWKITPDALRAYVEQQVTGKRTKKR